MLHFFNTRKTTAVNCVCHSNLPSFRKDAEFKEFFLENMNALFLSLIPGLVLHSPYKRSELSNINVATTTDL